MRFSASLLITVLYFTKTKADSSEDQSSFEFSHPSTVNFNEIFKNSLSMLNDDTLTVTKDEELNINNLPTQFVEFQHTATASNTTLKTRPRSLKVVDLNKEQRSRSTKKKTEPTSTTTEVAEFFTTSKLFEEDKEEDERRTEKRFTEKKAIEKQVIPFVNSRGRGVLDLLFPASRVKGFKYVFDTIRRMLSNTF